MIGLELDDTRAVAVAVDDAGNVLARAQEDGTDLTARAAVLAKVEGAIPAASGMEHVLAAARLVTAAAP